MRIVRLNASGSHCRTPGAPRPPPLLPPRPTSRAAEGAGWGRRSMGGAVGPWVAWGVCSCGGVQQAEPRRGPGRGERGACDGRADKRIHGGGLAARGVGEKRHRRQTGGATGPRDVATWPHVTYLVAPMEGGGAWRRWRREPGCETCGGDGSKRSREASEGDGVW
ncbi:hypothetical protein GUJ93_ZPchr0012g20698 [Zizania palustris]|uniref:Uncharacterized protein n=1 Tax=Zizania palustris TaxID=103762 RepID=A0A8J5WPU1_ZIZPA|nr:hypothetical protein GUJ93_ZPchr0012g20698 [Zizania palustris]